MKRFQFPLHAVLTLRQRQEQAALQVYAQALRRCEAVARSRQAVANELQAGWSLLETEVTSGAQATRLGQIHAYCRDRLERVRGLDQELEAARAAARREQDALLRATQNRESLERYQARQRRLYDYEVARMDQKVQDDLAARPAPLSGAWRLPNPTHSL